MKILIVDPDVVRAPELKLAFAAHGVDVTVAPNGSFALTMLEWNRHDAVVSRARIDDMEGHELCAILKSDPGTRDVRFVLVAGNDDVTTAQTTAAGVELVLPPALSAGGMVGLVLRLVNGDAAPSVPAAPPAARIQAAPPPVVPAATAPAPAPRPPAPVTSTPFARRPAPPVAPAPPPAPVTRIASPPSAPEPRPVIPASGVAPAPPSAPAPTVPKLRPDPVTTPAADPPKRYVTAAAAAAAAPWTKVPGVVATPPVAPAMNLEAMPSGTFQGSLEVMDLAELTQAIAMGRKNGRLILALPHGGGVVAFEGGQVVHAEYRGTVGETAFAALLTAAHADTAGRFCFLPTAAGEKVSPSRTIDKTVDRLLLSIATAIDEKG